MESFLEEEEPGQELEVCGVEKNVLGRHWRNGESPTDKLLRGRGWREGEAKETSSAGAVIMEALVGQAWAFRLHAPWPGKPWPPSLSAQARWLSGLLQVLGLPH